MSNSQRTRTSTFDRMLLAGFGIAVLVFGVLRILNGQSVVTHWTGQPVFSVGLIVAGTIAVLLAVLPAAWINRAAQVGPPARQRRRSK